MGDELVMSGEETLHPATIWETNDYNGMVMSDE